MTFMKNALIHSIINIVGCNLKTEAAGGLNGQMMRRVANFTNPKRLDEED